MNLEKQILIFLEHGCLLQVNYVDASDNSEKYSYIMKPKWFNKLPLICETKEDVVAWDVVMDKQFSLRDKLVNEIVYPSWPKQANLDEILSKPINDTDNSFVTDDVEYAEKIALAILEERLRLQNYLRSNCVETFHAYDVEELRDRSIIRFYPKQINPDNESFDEQSFNKLKQEIIEDFFTFSKQQVPEQHEYRALQMFGLKVEYIDCTDKLLLDAFKRQWRRMIEKEKRGFLNHLTSIDLEDFTEEEKAEFFQEAESLKNELENSISEKITPATNIKEIISFWPSLLQPVPTFVYVKEP